MDAKILNQKIKEYNAGKMIPMKFFWLKMLVMFGPVLILGCFYSEELSLGMGDKGFEFFKNLNQGIMMFVTGLTTVIFAMVLVMIFTFSNEVYEKARKKTFKDLIEKQKPFLDRHMRLRSNISAIVYAICIATMYSMQLGAFYLLVSLGSMLLMSSRIQKEKKWFVEFLEEEKKTT